MKKNDKKKGFTLIELLAVIVVLAIVSVLGATLILPALANARKNAFVTEANGLIDSAENAVSQIQLGTISKEDLASLETSKYYDLKKETNANTYCFTIEGLVKLGLYSKKSASNDGTIPGYNGRVEVIINKDSKMYQYKTTFSSKNYYVVDKIGSIETSDISEYSSSGDFSSVNAGKGTCDYSS